MVNKKNLGISILEIATLLIGIFAISNLWAQNLTLVSAAQEDEIYYYTPTSTIIPTSTNGKDLNEISFGDIPIQSLQETTAFARAQEETNQRLKTTAGNLGRWGSILLSLGLSSLTLLVMLSNPILGVIALPVLVILMGIIPEVSHVVVAVECDPWQAPLGGKDCEKCNGGKLPCTEYRCKSLGQSCELLNKGTVDQVCAWNSSGDVLAPIIEPWQEVLTEGYSYTPDESISPPNRGVKIINSADPAKCISVTQPLTFGVKLINEPAKCKLDSENKREFNEMGFFMGGNSALKYNHSQEINLLDLLWLQDEDSIVYQNEPLSFYVKCQDSNGNYNEASYVFNLCMEPGPDTMPPVIKGTSILNNSPIAFDQQQAEVDVYLNEPATCKWTMNDKDYNSMENDMVCDPVPEIPIIGQTYKCRATLKGLLNRQNNTFYFRCKDNPQETEDTKRNVNQQSYVYTLIGTQPILISKLTPEDGQTISGAGNYIPVTIKAETTDGFSKGAASCYLSPTGIDSSFVLFGDTGSYLHSQALNLNEGEYTYFVRCVDLGGNSDTKQISFSVRTDNSQPIVVRSYYEESNLKIITNENAQCVYDVSGCNYPFEKGIAFRTVNNRTHFTEWKPELGVHYIKCRDLYGNQPDPNVCSIVIKPVKFL